MTRAMTPTLLPLDTFFRVLGVHPLHSSQVVYAIESDDRGLTCDEPLVQYSWMRADRTGREEIAQIIAQAEQNLAEQLGYLPGVRWVADEEVQFPRPANPMLYNMPAIDVRGFNQSFRTKYGFVISGGTEAKTLIANAAVVFSDLDGDGYFETATVTSATTITDEDEIALFYPGESGDNAWEIRPLRSVVIAGGIVTVVCNRAQLLAPELQEGFSEAASRAVDSQDDTKFLANVDIYRRWNNPATQAQFVWSPLATNCDCLFSGGCPSCTFSLQEGCLMTRDARLGVVSAQPATWDAVDSEFTPSVFSVWRAPDKVKLYYRTGYRNLSLTRPLSTLDSDWARVITYYAASMLDRPLCGCKTLESQIMYWRQNLAVTVTTQAGTTQFRTSNKMLDNPLGTTRGAVNAWQLVKRKALGEGVANA